MSIYKNILENQEKKCKICDIAISGQPRFVYKDNTPVCAICSSCGAEIDVYNAESEIAIIYKKRTEKRKKERDNWLDESNPNYETRLRCSNSGHKVIQGGHGFVGGGCWCGYYSPEEKPIKYVDFGEV
jgi:hypothetical protein